MYIYIYVYMCVYIYIYIYMLNYCYIMLYYIGGLGRVAQWPEGGATDRRSDRDGRSYERRRVYERGGRRHTPEARAFSGSTRKVRTPSTMSGTVQASRPSRGRCR